MKHEKKNGEGCSQTRAILYRAHHKCLRASQQIQGSRRKREKKGGSKRTKTWAEKLHKRNKKTSKGKSMHGEKESEAIKSHPPMEINSGVEDYAFSGSFTQLLMVETSSRNSFMKSLPKPCYLHASLGMAIYTRVVGPWRVWHPSSVGAGLNLHPWVHPHPTWGGSGHGFQSTPTGPHWPPVYSPYTIILGLETRLKTRRHPKPASKSVDTR
jgi:hypothetical protein